MKKVLLILLVALPLFTMAQKDSNYVGGDNRHLVAIVGYNVNSVVNYLGNFMNDELEFTHKDGPKKELPYHMTIPFGPKLTSNPKSGLTMHYTVDNKYVIQKFSVDGYYMDVIKLFVRYWPTTINFDEAVKQQTAIKYLYTDKIILTVNTPAKTAKIEVVRNN